MVDWPKPSDMRLRHRLERAWWRKFTLGRIAGAVEALDPESSQLERMELAIAMVWPLARDVFLMHRIDDLDYVAIAHIRGINVKTVEICIYDALCALTAARNYNE
jgi:DNA-directed RNA polymerase specialized sigma24 family protein